MCAFMSIAYVMRIVYVDANVTIVTLGTMLYMLYILTYYHVII